MSHVRILAGRFHDLLIALIVLCGVSLTLSLVPANAWAATNIESSTASAVRTVTTPTDGYIHTAKALAKLPQGCKPRAPYTYWRGLEFCVIQGDQRPGKIWVVFDGKTVLEQSRYDRTARSGNGPPSDGSAQNPTRNGQYRVDPNRIYLKTFSKLFHVWMPYTMYFDGGEAIHYSSEFARGYPYSHGCVGVRDQKFAQWMYWTAFHYLQAGVPVRISVTGPIT